MRDGWARLSERERLVVRWGGMVVGMLLMYLFLWAPLHENVMVSRDKLLADQSLLIWMQQADRQIASLEAGKKSAESSSVSLLTAVQNSLRENALASQLTACKELEDKTIQISGSHVQFDRLMSWLINEWAEHGVIVSRIVVTSTDAPGIVSATLTLTY